jgi:hypothetical protein
MGIISKITDWVTTPYTIYLIIKDPTISRSVKIRSIIGLVIIFAYVIAPVDIVPDFIPFSGWLDDLVVVPLGLALMRKFIPDIGVLERKERVQASVRRILIRAIFSIAIFAFLAVIWLGIIIYVIVKLITG